MKHLPWSFPTHVDLGASLWAPAGGLGKPPALGCSGCSYMFLGLSHMFSCFEGCLTPSYARFSQDFIVVS